MVAMEEAMTARDVAIDVLGIKKISPYGTVLYDRVLSLVESYYPPGS